LEGEVPRSLMLIIYPKLKDRPKIFTYGMFLRSGEQIKVNKVKIDSTLGDLCSDIKIEFLPLAAIERKLFTISQLTLEYADISKSTAFGKIYFDLVLDYVHQILDLDMFECQEDLDMMRREMEMKYNECW